MGSCFAVEIRRALRAQGRVVYPDYQSISFDPGTQSPGLLPGRDNINHYDTFVIRQEIERAIEGRRWRESDFWSVSRIYPMRIRAMINRRIAIVCFVISIGWLAMMGVTCSCAAQNSRSSIKFNALNGLQIVLGDTKKVGRVYYRSNCSSNEVGSDVFAQSIPFPEMRIRPAMAHHKGLAAIQDSVRGNKGVTVSESPAGVVRIRIDRPSDALMQTKISSLNLTHDEQYDARSAIFAIFQTKEVSAALSRLQIRRAMSVESYASSQSTALSPHLPSSITDATVDRMLDKVAVTFRGVVVYGICSQPQVFDVEFVPIGTSSP